MVYIIVLNWKGAADTIACLNSLFFLKDVKFRIVVCDNASPDNSYPDIRDWLINQKKQSSGYMTNCCLIELSKEDSLHYLIPEEDKSIYLIQTGANLGYAGGNNVGIRFAMNQPDMSYVWVLNNDTEVEPDSLYHMVKRCESNTKIGICGSKLVYHHDRSKLQGIGGLYNPWLCTTKHYAAFSDSQSEFDDIAVAKKIDYIIGASILLTKPLLEKVGLLCEDYFLYYEEIDLALRAKGIFSLGVASNSIVYHKEGASMDGGRSVLSDSYSVRNKIKVTKKFYPQYYLFVYLSLILVLLNRLRRLEFKKALGVLYIIMGLVK